MLVARLAGASLMLVARLAGASLMLGARLSGASSLVARLSGASSTLTQLLVAHCHMGASLIAASALCRKQRAVAWPMHHQQRAFSHSIGMALCRTVDLRGLHGTWRRLAGVQ